MEIQYLKGIGPRRAEAFNQEGVFTLADLLNHMPRRYEDRTQMLEVGEASVGIPATFVGAIVHSKLKRLRGRMTILEVMISDGSGTLLANWFNQPFLAEHFRLGRRVLFFGTPKIARGKMALNGPDFEFLEDDPEQDPVGQIVPVYRKLGGVSPKPLRKIIASALDKAEEDPDVLGEDPIPKALRLEHDLVGQFDALKDVHQPLILPPRGRKRLVFEEFFFLQMGLMTLRKASGSGVVAAKARAFDPKPETGDKLRAILPFSFTGAQKNVFREICDDLTSDTPMNRLLQGDVGSGKTIVALLAMVFAAANGLQAALLAPTEILAEQHFRNITALLKGHGLLTGMLCGSQTPKDKRLMLSGLKSGRVHLAVGTHALFQDKVEFSKLGLVVVDEQHRFGVSQRAALREKGVAPHLLVMSATPIPRSLCMTLYGDLDLSIIDELPPGRTPIATKVYEERDRGVVYRKVKKAAEKGQQTYVVCPLVEESDKLDLRSAEALKIELEQGHLEGVRVGLLHGRMTGEQKITTMRRFENKEIDVLVSTVVIEVGVDVPNATTMVIEHADRFGLAQLHQLRGRVGRGKQASHCYLIRTKRSGGDSLERLRALEASTDGFFLAEKDLALRGPGDILGTRQSGIPPLRLGDLVADKALLLDARTAARKVVAGEIEMDQSEKRALWAATLKAWGELGTILAAG